MSRALNHVAPRVRQLLERYNAVPDPAITPEENDLMREAETAFMALVPCRLQLAARWYAPAAKLLVLGPARAGLSGTELFACRGIITEAREAMHDAAKNASIF
jgi:hypothetical protein